MAYWAVLGFFCFVMAIAGMALFFGSDYAQNRWNPKQEPVRSDEASSALLVVSDYRVRERVR